MWRKLIPYWRPSRRATIAGLVVLLAAAGLELLLPWPVKWLVDYILGPHPAPDWLVRLWPPFDTGDRSGAVAGVCLAGLLLAILHRAAVLVGQAKLIEVGGQMVLELRRRGYEQFCRLSLSYHDQRKTGDSLHRIAYDTHAAMTLISGALVPMLQAAVILCGIVVIMLRMDWLLTLVAVAVAPLFWISIRTFGRRIEERSRRYQESESGIVSTVQESLSSMRAVQAFTREPDTSLRFGRQADESCRRHIGLIRTQLAFAGAVGVAMAAGTAGAIWLGAHRALAGYISAGDVIVFLAYLGMLYQPLNSLSQCASVIQSTRAQLERVFEVLEAAREIADRPGARELSGARGAIGFRHVSFGYDPSRPVLQDVSLDVRPGEVIALVGPTGAGKTTLASLLLRFYDPVEGAVLLDGCDLRDLRIASVRRQVSVVLQDALLLSGSVKENICYGRPEATMDEIREAARKAQAHEFIVRLPDGYDTHLAERAVNLSGGQKQRIAIARAFLKDAPILVLDEPTSALDAETEDALLNGLRSLVKGRTTFIIAHRFSTVRLASRIVVMRDGRIVEEGTHDELLATESYYRQLYRMQVGLEREPALTTE